MWLPARKGLLAACCAVGLAAPVRGQDLVQAVVEGLSDPAVAREASVLVEQQPGVLMARFDVRTRNVMLHVTEDCGISSNSLQGLLLPMGIQVRCYERRDARERPFRHLDPERCMDQPVLSR